MDLSGKTVVEMSFQNVIAKAKFSIYGCHIERPVCEGLVDNLNCGLFATVLRT